MVGIIQLSETPTPSTGRDGFIATRGKQCDEFFNTYTTLNSRTTHYARSDITDMFVVFGNYYINTGSTCQETGPRASTSITATLEYPSGTFTRLTFSASNAGTIADGGILNSDRLTGLNITAGSQFWIRTFRSCSAGIYVAGGYSKVTAIGDMANVSGVDQTASTFTDAGINPCFPVAIIGTTKSRSVAILGDSIAWGCGTDPTPSATGDMGLIERSIGPVFGYANLSMGFDEAQFFVASHTNRVQMLQYATTVIVEYGRNDFYVSGRTLAQVEADLTTINGYMPSSVIAVYQTLMTPDTTSTDGWATLANQTLGSQETQMAGLNSGLTGGTFNPGAKYAGYYDMRSVLGQGTGNAYWGNSLTTDGIHPTSGGYALVASSGVISTSSIR